MIQLLVASSNFQLLCLAAMIDTGALPAAEDRVLVLANGSLTPELTVPLDESPGFETLASRFDKVVDLGALTSPRRAGAFNPSAEELVTYERLLRQAWGLGSEQLMLVVESIQVNPAQALARIFHDAPILVHSDGLMSYGPTRNRLPRPITQRIIGTCHVDLVPGLEPVLLRELDPQRKVVPLPALRRVFEQLAEVTSEGAQLPAVPENHALVLGQYLGALGLLDDAEELELHLQMLQRAVDSGVDHVVFKPHPSSSPAATYRLAALAAERGLGFTWLRSALLAETVIQLMKPQLVISCFSTALATAKYMLQVPVSAVGTRQLLEQLAPYQNSNRIPLSLIHALLVEEYSCPTDASGDDMLTPLVKSIAYCMQAEQLPMLRAEAERFLQVHYSRATAYFKRRRLAALGLPPHWAHPEAQRNPVIRLRRAAGRRVRGVRRHSARMFSRMAQKLDTGI